MPTVSIEQAQKNYCKVSALQTTILNNGPQTQTGKLHLRENESLIPCENEFHSLTMSMR